MLLTAAAEIPTDARSAEGRLDAAAAQRGRNAPLTRGCAPPRAYVADGLPGSHRLVASQR